MRLILTDKGIKNLKEKKNYTRFLPDMRGKQDLLIENIGKLSSNKNSDSLQAQFDAEENISPWRNQKKDDQKLARATRQRQQYERMNNNATRKRSKSYKYFQM